MSRKARVEMIDRSRSKLSVSRQCKLVGVRRSSLHCRPVEPDQKDIDIIAKMDRDYLKTPLWLQTYERVAEKPGAQRQSQAGKASDAPHRA